VRGALGLALARLAPSGDDRRMRAAVFHGPNDVRVTDVPEPCAGAGEAIVRVSVAGICGGDVNRFRYGAPGSSWATRGHHEAVALDWRRVLMNQQQIIGSIIYRRDDFAEAIGILAGGTVAACGCNRASSRIRHPSLASSRSSVDRSAAGSRPGWLER
jgi:threonine dehydrogenase-like Zn-dependent dehydrogenase